MVTSEKALRFELRPRTEQEEAFLERLYRDVHAGEFSPLGLGEASLAQLLAMQFRAQRMGYAAQFPEAEDLLIWVDGVRVGRVLTSLSEGLMQLVDIAILAEYRGRGLGTMIVDGLKEQARTLGVPLRLSVRFDSAAARLYERAGFVRAGADGINIAMEYAAGEQKAAVEEAAAEESGVPAEQGMTSAYFRWMRGKKFRARGAGGVETELELRTVTLLKAPASGAPVELEDSFVLEFEGPLTAVLAPAIAELTPAEGEPMEIFVSPLGPEGGVMKYESVFNRMRVV